MGSTLSAILICDVVIIDGYYSIQFGIKHLTNSARFVDTVKSWTFTLYVQKLFLKSQLDGYIQGSFKSEVCSI